MQREAYDLLKDFKKRKLTYSQVLKELEEHDIKPIYYVSNIVGSKVCVRSVDDDIEDIFSVAELNRIVRKYPFFVIDGLDVSDDYKIQDISESDKAKKGNAKQLAHNTKIALLNKNINIKSNQYTGVLEKLRIDVCGLYKDFCENHKDLISNHSLPYSYTDIYKKDSIYTFRLSDFLTSAATKSVNMYYSSNQYCYINIIIDDKINFIDKNFLEVDTGYFYTANPCDLKVRFIIESANPNVLTELLRFAKPKKIRLKSGGFTNRNIGFIYKDLNILFDLMDKNSTLRNLVLSKASDDYTENYDYDEDGSATDILFRYGKLPVYDIGMPSTGNKKEMELYLKYEHLKENGKTILEYNVFKFGRIFSTNIGKVDLFYLDRKEKGIKLYMPDLDKLDDSDKFKDRYAILESNYKKIKGYLESLDEKYNHVYSCLSEELKEAMLNTESSCFIDYVSEYEVLLNDIVGYISEVETGDKSEYANYEDVFTPKYIDIMKKIQMGTGFLGEIKPNIIKSIVSVLAQGFDINYILDDIINPENNKIYISVILNKISKGLIKYLEVLYLNETVKEVRLNKKFVSFVDFSSYSLNESVGRMLYYAYGQPAFGYYALCSIIPRFSVPVIEDDELYINVMDIFYPLDEEDVIFDNDDITCVNDYIDCDNAIEQLIYIDDIGNYVNKKSSSLTSNIKNTLEFKGYNKFINDLKEIENLRVILDAIWRILYKEIMKFDGDTAMKKFNVGKDVPHTVMEFLKYSNHKITKKAIIEEMKRVKDVDGRLPINKLNLFDTTYWKQHLIESIVYMVKTPKEETLFKNELFDVYYNSTDNLEQDKYTELYDYI